MPGVETKRFGPNGCSRGTPARVLARRRAPWWIRPGCWQSPRVIQLPGCVSAWAGFSGRPSVKLGQGRCALKPALDFGRWRRHPPWQMKRQPFEVVAISLEPGLVPELPGKDTWLAVDNRERLSFWWLVGALITQPFPAPPGLRQQAKTPSQVSIGSSE